MADGTARTFSASLRGAGASQMTLGGIDLLRSGLIKGVDVYLEAGQAPQVVIRPVLLDQVSLDLTAGDLDGKAPRCVVAPDVAFLLEELGWMSPDSAEVVHHTLATRDRERDELKAQLAGIQSQHQVALDRIRSLESEREELSRAHFSCGDKMVTLEQERDQWRTSFNQAHETEAHLSQQAAQLQDALTDARERIAAQEAELETAAQAVEKAQDDKARLEAEVESWKRSADQAGVAILEISRERGEAQDKVAQMAEELANAHGQMDDLKLANQTLQQEMESLQAETAGRHPYDPAA